jgi:hypothetical protein
VREFAEVGPGEAAGCLVDDELFGRRRVVWSTTRRTVSGMRVEDI